MKKVIILTQYFPPEVGAPQNRLYDLACRLTLLGAKVTVLTAMPNYPTMEVRQEYVGKWSVTERMDDIEVIRSWIYVRNSSKSIIRRVITFLSFTFSSLLVGLRQLERGDYLICESPPIFLGLSAWILSRVKKAHFILNVSDLWVESAKQAGVVKNSAIIGFAGWLETFIYRRAFIIAGQTEGIVTCLKGKFPRKQIYCLRNGVDLGLFDVTTKPGSWRTENRFGIDEFIVLYAGILGFMQGLDVLVGAAERLPKSLQIKFVLMGSGPEKERLQSLAAEKRLTNVVFLDPQPRERMPEIIASCDVGVIPLRKLAILKGAVPSKSFEFLAMKKPILLGAEGEAVDLLISEGNAGLQFNPEDAGDLATKILQLYGDRELCGRLGESGLAYVRRKFDRRDIAKSFWDYLESHTA